MSEYGVHYFTADNGQRVGVQDDDLADMGISPVGWGLGCGAEACVEPDAHNYQCNECEQQKVFGSEGLLMSGRLRSES